jgi:hypothetical protein
MFAWYGCWCELPDIEDGGPPPAAGGTCWRTLSRIWDPFAAAAGAAAFGPGLRIDSERCLACVCVRISFVSVMISYSWLESARGEGCKNAPRQSEASALPCSAAYQEKTKYLLALKTKEHKNKLTHLYHFNGSSISICLPTPTST